ncbi:uncharacterized protein Z518_09277 [Rhinocladiella mackenziei CBS 650.93]|uniref:RING-type E3 ubiquitin transferase n=1 Tax=Rhinocladiella mackenziei CBS 650.93 TaxID=1442369 RepID=A0A0D2IE87_9EURO|nr:uncharacterized protein Z518_09277 [Rhinocladiella mackenziei CBS 650.93]KIX01551.1 hypothetical protein Z518_09277 [Rhinocladiella mackenziei CBS 650.93]
MPVRLRMRWTAYAGVSTALAAGVVLKALAQRPNFYSAAVYLSQSSANLMILTNLLFVVACTFMLGLQKLLYGSLRPIEIEQLYEKAWFAVTETCLAMTVFRGEIGLTFLAMFFALLTGKVWGWIGEGRVEVLEQQPPRNPRLFHTRLALSLGLSVAFDLTMLEYVVNQVMRMARPDMMVMFGFEFAVLSIMSVSTAMKYAINLVEIGIVREQKRTRIEEIKRERAQAAVSEFQAAQSRQAENATISNAWDQPTTTPTPTQRTVEQVSQEAFNQPVDDNEVEVEGWEEKGRYIFYLHLATDFFKLVIYLAFFFILLVFYGLPIHILRDVFLTMRSFLKRISDFMKYRTATRDMNERYPDATAADIGPDDVCIICREEMTPHPGPVAEPGQPSPRPNPMAERMRPKKLPCGHVLHFSCLRSWLERQQICPTCRANVVRPARPMREIRETLGFPQEGAVAQGEGRQPQPGARQGPRVYQFGPLRIGIGAARGNNMFEDLQQQLGDVRAPVPPPDGDGDINAPRQFGLGFRWGGLGPQQRRGNLTTHEEIQALEMQLQEEIEELARSSAQLGVLRSMQAELQRLRNGGPLPPTNAAAQTSTPNPHLPPPSGPPSQHSVPPRPFMTLSSHPQTLIPAGSDRLPPGVTLPEGWTMMPLQPYNRQEAITHRFRNQMYHHRHHHHSDNPTALVPQPPAQEATNGQGLGGTSSPPQNTWGHNLFQPMPQGPVRNGTHRPEPTTGTHEQTAAPQTNDTPSATPNQPSSIAPSSRVEDPNILFNGNPGELPAWLHERWLASLRNRNDQGAPGDSSNVTPGNSTVANTSTGPAGSSVANSTSVPENAPATDSQAAVNGTRPHPSTDIHTAPSENQLLLPSWGSSPPLEGGEGSRDPSQINGNREEENAAEPSSKTSEPKNRNATVEDLVEDPD